MSVQQHKKRLYTTASLLALFTLVFAAGVVTNAQKGKKRPPTDQTATQHGNANTTTAQQQKPPKKNITPLHSGDTADGSRITITSDAPLNDYSAYRSGDRFYVIIPNANAPRAQAGMRGRGFDEVQVQKRGNDTIISLRLQPGTHAIVDQRYNRLDIELTAPAGAGQNIATGTPSPTATPDIATQPTPRSTPQLPNNSQANDATNSSANSTAASPPANVQGTTQEQMNAASAKGPLRKEQLIEALQVGGDVVSSSEFVRRIQERGVNFELTPTTEEELRAAGASAETIEAIRANYRPATASSMTEKTSSPSKATSSEETTSVLEPTVATPEQHYWLRILYIFIGAIALVAFPVILYAFRKAKNRRLKR